MTRTMRPGATARTTTRAAALGALVIALAAGCSGTDDAGSPADGGSDTSTSEDSGASDDGGAAAADGAASDGGSGDGAASDGGASDGGGSDDTGGGTGASGEAGTPLPEDADLATEQLAIPAEDAVSIAVETVGGGETESVEIDHDDDHGWTWEIEVRADGQEHDLEIDATTGEVLEHEQERDRVEDPAVDVTSPMTPQEAIEIALQEREGRVSGWDLDAEDGSIRYQIDLETSGDDDVEIEVDVETGEVRIDD